MKSFRIITVSIFMFLVAFTVFAGGNKEVPDLEVATSGTQYISPDGNNVQDSAQLDFKVKIYVKSKEGYVPEYGLKIKNSSGDVITEVSEKEKSDINWFIRIFKKYSEFTLEKSVIWDGFDTDGNKVPDGVYNVEVWVKDSSGNIDEVDIDDFVVDIIKPSVELVKPDKMIFSPNNDNNRDMFILKQENSSSEALWTGEVLSEKGDVVKTYKWENSTLPDLEWDGTDNNRNKAEDGNFSYRLNSTDLSGNIMEELSVDGIVMDSTLAEVVFELSDNYFSPNDDGLKDTITATFGQKTIEGLIGWSVSMADISGNLILTQKDTEPGIYEVVIDGKGEQGEKLSEGAYTLGFSSEYKNGSKIVLTDTIYLDITPPVITFDAKNPVFSPDGNGSRDTFELSMKSNKVVKWKGQMTDDKGSVIGEMTSEDTTSLVILDGTDENGNDLSDGEYTIEGYFEDLAGNPYVPEDLVIKIDRNEKSASLAAIPGAEKGLRGLDGIANFEVDSEYMDEVEKWTFKVSDEEGFIIYEDSGSEVLPEIITIPGEREDAEEGDYSVSFHTVYKNGSISEDFGKYFYDLTPPVVDLEITPYPFAVNGDKLDGEVVFDTNVKDESPIYGWNLILNDTDGNKADLEGKGLENDIFSWYGEGFNAEKRMSGKDFSASLKLTDMNGNSTTVEGDFAIDIIASLVNGRYYIMVPDIIFAAYKDNLFSKSMDTGDKNIMSIRKVADLYKKYPDYSVILEGHALNVFYSLSNGRKSKEEEVLVPLTERRAEEVKKALIKEGVPEDKIKVEYFGGKKPVASTKDKSIWWKNRRVDFAIDTK